jgi:hypothetical protein
MTQAQVRPRESTGPRRAYRPCDPSRRDLCVNPRAQRANVPVTHKAAGCRFYAKAPLPFRACAAAFGGVGRRQKAVARGHHPHLLPPSHLPTFSPFHLSTFPPSHLPTFSPSHLPTFSPSHLLTSSPSHLLTFLPPLTPPPQAAAALPPSFASRSSREPSRATSQRSGYAQSGRMPLLRQGPASLPRMRRRLRRSWQTAEGSWQWVASYPPEATPGTAGVSPAPANSAAPSATPSAELADGRRQLAVGTILTSSHLPTFPPSHLPTFPPSHLPTFPPSHLSTFPPSHLLTSLPSHLLPPSHLPTFPPSHLPTSSTFPPPHPAAGGGPAQAIGG